MRPLIHFFAMLYPPRWRQRYGAEFDVLIDDASPTAKTALNVFTGAISMQIRMWKVGKILAVGGLAGALVALGIALAMPKQYTSISVVKITPSSPQEMADNINSMANSILSRRSLTQTVNVLGLYQSQRARMPIEDVIDMMHRNIAIRPVRPAGSTIPAAFAIDFNYSDPLLAQKVTQDLTGKFIQENVRQGSGSMRMEILDPASLPKKPVSPNVPIIAFFGLLGGLALGGIFTLAVRLTRPKAA